MKYRVIIFCTFLYNAPAIGIVIGSNTVTSRQSTVVFPAVDTNNEIRGFAAMDEGFTLENSSTTCTFNAFYPVQKDLTLNGGTLFLSQDMYADDNFRMINVGTINGNGKSFILTTTGALSLVSGGGGYEFFSFITSDDVGNDALSVDWSFNDQYVAVGTEGNRLLVYSFNGSLLDAVENINLTRSVESVAWHPTDYLLASGILNNSGSQTELTLWRFNPITEQLLNVSSINLNTNIHALAWRPIGSFLVVARQSFFQKMILYSVTGDTLTQIDATDVFLSGYVQRNALSWDSSGTYIVAGTAQLFADELLMYYFNGAALTFTLGVNINETVSAVDWSPTGTYIAVGLSSGSERLRVYKHTVSDGTLVEIPAARVGESASVLSIDWSNDGTSLVVGLESNSSTEFRRYVFNEAMGTLSIASSQSVFGSVNIVKWSNANNYIATGDDANNLSIYGFNTINPTGDLVFKNIYLMLHGDLLCTNTLRFQGDCTIDMTGHDILLQTNGHLVVDSGSSLRFKDAYIYNIYDRKLRCLDSLATVSLQDVSIQLDGDWTFSLGSINVQQDVVISGTQRVIYQSAGTITVEKNSMLYCDQNLTFSYEPLNSSNSRMVFKDSSSQWYLDNASLYVSNAGLQLLKGTCIINGFCNVSNNASSSSFGLIFGSGSTIVDNMRLKILQGSELSALSGYIVYKNVPE